MIDVVIEPEHPQIEQVAAAINQLGGQLLRCVSGDWSAALTSGQAEWIVLIDRRAELNSTDLPRLASDLRQATTPIWLQPWSETNPAEWFAWQACPPAVAACWNNPIRFASISCRRSQLPTFPAFARDHLDVLWAWLCQAALKTNTVSWTATSNSDQPWSWTEDSFFLLPALVPPAGTSGDAWLIEHITSLKPSQLVPQRASEADSVALKAGLLLWHDALDASHQLSQSVEGLGKHHSGDYWHAILHRREPDYGNAKYWFRQLGVHPVFAALAPRVQSLLEHASLSTAEKSQLNRFTSTHTWNPMTFVDFCEELARHQSPPLEWLARQIQATEMQLLLATTYRDACGQD